MNNAYRVEQLPTADEIISLKSCRALENETMLKLIDMKKKFYLSDYNDLVDLSEYVMTPRQAILAKCKECCGFSSMEAHRCNIKTCALHNLLVRFTKKSVTRAKYLESIEDE